MNCVYKVLLCFVLGISAVNVRAQETWPSPEAEQMYGNAREAESRGNYNDAIIIYRQALILTPGNMQLTKGLAGALTKAGHYSEANTLLIQLSTQGKADAESFVLLADNQVASGHTKKAIETVDHALSSFPNSGLLYHELGNLYRKQKSKVEALNAWIDGIEKDPAEPSNYRAAALVYLSSYRVLWGLLYAEQYLNLQHDTTGDYEIKVLMYRGYTTYFDNLVQDAKQITGDRRTSFENAVMRVYTTLTPVISDGIDVESLTMLRVRFLLEWSATYADKYPCALFAYEEDMINSGWFDIYIEWLYGQAESAAQYKAWNTFHSGDLERFNKWHATHPFRPVAGQTYNSRATKGLFKKEK